MATIGFAGDISATGSHPYRIDASIWEGTEIVCANLEAPRTQSRQVRPKAGPALRGDGEIDYGEQLYCLSLANNHLMDYGERGLLDSIQHCRERGFRFVGAGRDLSRAAEPVILRMEDLRVGILARCEPQFGTATDTTAGTAALDATIYGAIRKLRRDVDSVILLVHGGPELSPWPAPAWQDQLRSFVEAGVDIVAGHHSHVPQGFESYESGIIFYGLGNFLADPRRWHHRPNADWSIATTLDLREPVLRDPRTVVFEEREDEVIVRPSNTTEASRHSRYLAKCNEPLGDRELLTSMWHEVATRLYRRFYAEWLEFEPFPPRRRRSRLQRWIRSKRPRALGRDIEKLRRRHLLRYHLFACDTHRMAISTALGIASGELPDARTERSQEIVDELLPWSLADPDEDNPAGVSVDPS